MKHVTFHLPSFLRRVRIHGGEFDSSARAMNRVKQVRLLQADLRIVRGSTIERKQMSTTIKRISLVAVAALGLSLVSVVPSSAAINQDTLTLSAATAAQTTAETFTATSAVATLSFLGSTGDSASVTAALVSGPAGNTALPYLRLTETASATINGSGTLQVTNASAQIAPNTAVAVGAGAGTAVTTAKFAIALGVAGSPITAPTVAGTYVVRVTPATIGASGALLGAAAVNLTITVTTAAAQDKAVDVAKSTSIINLGETTSATADATATGSMALPAAGAANDASAATIVVALNNAAGSAVVESYTASILSGPGLLGAGVQSNATAHAAVASGRALTVKNTDSVGVFPDGTSGVSKIEIRTAAGVLIATETVTFFGDVASIVATVVSPVVGVGSNTGAITAVAKDAAGTTVTAPKLYITSGTTTIISNSYSEKTGSKGVTTFDLTGVKAGTASLVVSNGSTAALSTVSAAAVSVRVGGGKAELDGVLVATDKTSYAPGELVTLTVTPTDVAGLSLGNDTYTVFTSAGIVSSHNVTMVKGVLTLAGAHNAGTDGTGTVKNAAVYTFYAPNIEGDLKLSWTRSAEYATAANDDLTGSITLAISSPGTAAATDAANEATDAANAATDAALAAAEAADAATSAAQEASDAVAALSESVTKLIAGLQAQIKSLAAVVAKIAKKVKA
jgi:trimeric autotransporter adhesin